MYLTETHPHLIKEFICEKNFGIDPCKLKPNSNKRVWWRCEFGHEYATKVGHRTASGSNCPYCSGRKLTPEKSLAACNPTLAAEFHPLKNGALTPSDIFNSSGKSYMWRCAVNHEHEWKASVDNRQKGKGCPYCSGKKVLPQDSFAKKHPDLLEEWDHDLNKVDPLTLAVKSNLKVWWKCKSKSYHRWPTTIARRTNGTGCPYCKGQKLHENDSAFHAISKLLIIEFDQTLNPLIDLKKINVKFPTALVWKCAANTNHKPWKACISSRVEGRNNCPECNPHMTKNYKDSLAYRYPEIAEEWHPDNIYTPSQVSPGSGKMVKWICLYRPNHVYESRVAQRVKGHRCPKCQNAPTLPELRLFAELSLFYQPLLHHKIGDHRVDIFIQEANLAIEWDSFYHHKDRLESDIKKTSSLLAQGINVIRVRHQKLNKISTTSQNLRIVDTDKDTVDFELFKDVLMAIICLCSSEKGKLDDALSLKEFVNIELYEKIRLTRGRLLVVESLEETHAHVVPYWHPNKNKLIKPSDVSAFSHEEYWFFCEKCGSEWNDKLVNVSSRKDVCLMCSKQQPSSEYSLLKCYPEIALELIDADPSQIHPYAGKKLNWKCSKCNHIWSSIVNNRTGKKQSCPKCVGKHLTLEKSVASSLDACKAWDFAKNLKKPEEIFINTHDKYSFLCLCGTSMPKRPRDFILKNQRKCPACVTNAKKNSHKMKF